MKGLARGDRVETRALYGEAALSRTLLGEKGIALIIVLWVLAFLMFIVVEFAYTMRVETDTVRNLKDETAARYLALAGLNMGLAELSVKYDIVFLNKDAELMLGKQDESGVSTFDVKREFAMGDGSLKYSIADEVAKLNLNIATRAQIAELLRLTGVERVERDIIADSILDWRDKNHEFHFNGAEDDYYGSLPIHTELKTAPLRREMNSSLSGALRRRYFTARAGFLRSLPFHGPARLSTMIANTPGLPLMSP